MTPTKLNHPRTVHTLLAAALTAIPIAYWAPVRAQALPAGRLQAALEAVVADPATPFRGALVHVHRDDDAWSAAGGGALVTTTQDLATFLEALLDGRMFRDPGSLAAMTDFVDAADAGGQVGYGLGLQRYLFPGDLAASDAFPAGLEAIGHLGGTAGYASFVAYLPALDLTVALAIDVQGDPTPVLAAVLRVLAAAGAGGAL